MTIKKIIREVKNTPKEFCYQRDESMIKMLKKIDKVNTLFEVRRIFWEYQDKGE